MNCSTSRRVSRSRAVVTEPLGLVVLIGLILHQRAVVAPDRALRDLVRRIADRVAVLVDPLAVHPALDREPLRAPSVDASLVALVHLRVVREQESGGADGADRLLEHPP